MDKVLVTYATKYGSTREVAEKVAERLRAQGLDATLEPAGSVGALDGFSGVVLGAPLYVGAMPRAASSFLQRHRAELNRIPTAVFVLGPMHASDGFEVPREQLGKILANAGVQPVATEVFVGAYDPEKLRGLDKMITWMPASPLKGEGRVDERDWNAIDAWADALPEALGMRATLTSVT